MLNQVNVGASGSAGAPTENMPSTPQKIPESRTDLPKMQSRQVPATPEPLRRNPGLAKQLERAMIDSSIRYSPVRLDLTDHEIGTASTSTTSQPDTVKLNSPRREKKLERQHRSLIAHVSSTPRRGVQADVVPQPFSAFRTVVEEPAAKPLTQPPSPYKPIRAPMSPLFVVKNKVEELLSPKSEARKLLEGVEWIKLTNSQQSRADRPGQSTTAAEPPMSDRHAGNKRKLSDAPPGRPTKRLRFKDNHEQIAPQTAPDREKGHPRPSDTGRHDAPTQTMQPPDIAQHEEANTALPEQKAGRNDAAAYPYPPSGLGKAILRAIKKDESWFTTNPTQSGSSLMMTGLNQLQESNQGIIDDEACGYLQQMFLLLPAGAIAGSEIFRKGLERSVRELPLTVSQWGQIEALVQDFNRLDLSRNPQGFGQFKTILNYMILTKNRIARLDS